MTTTIHSKMNVLVKLLPVTKLKYENRKISFYYVFLIYLGSFNLNM